MEFLIESEGTFVQNGIHGPTIAKEVRIKGWEGFTDEQKEACRLELRRQNVKSAESEPVDPSALEEKLRQLAAAPDFRRSPTSELSGSFTWINGEYTYRIERESYHALLDDGGTPFQSFEPQLELCQDPEDPDLMDYWNSVADNGQVFTAQLAGWKRFRHFQRTVRKRKDWQVYLNEVRHRRQTYGLDGDVILKKNPDAQSKLTTWQEYQEFEHRLQEDLEKSLDTDQETFATILAELGEDSITELPRINAQNGSEVPLPFTVILTWQKKASDAGFRVELAEKKVDYMRDRLDRASRYPEGPINRRAWLLVEVIELEIKVQSTKQYYEKATEDEHFYYVNELERANTVLENSRFNADETIEANTLVSKLQGELESSLSELEEEKVKQKHLKLCCHFIGAWSDKFTSEKEVKQHRFLLSWIERQRLLLISKSKRPYDSRNKPTDTDEGGQRVLRSRSMQKRKFSHEPSAKEQKEAHVKVDILSNQRVLRPRASLKRPPEPHMMVNAGPAKKQRLLEKAPPKKANKTTGGSKEANPRPSRQVVGPAKNINARKPPTRAKRSRGVKEQSTPSSKIQKPKRPPLTSGAKSTSKAAGVVPKQPAGQKRANPTTSSHGRLRRSSRIVRKLSIP